MKRKTDEILLKLNKYLNTKSFNSISNVLTNNDIYGGNLSHNGHKILFSKKDFQNINNNYITNYNKSSRLLNGIYKNKHLNYENYKKYESNIEPKYKKMKIENNINLIQRNYNFDSKKGERQFYTLREKDNKVFQNENNFCSDNYEFDLLKNKNKRKKININKYLINSSIYSPKLHFDYNKINNILSKNHISKRKNKTNYFTFSSPFNNKKLINEEKDDDITSINSEKIKNISSFSLNCIKKTSHTIQKNTSLYFSPSTTNRFSNSNQEYIKKRKTNSKQFWKKEENEKKYKEGLNKRRKNKNRYLSSIKNKNICYNTNNNDNFNDLTLVKPNNNRIIKYKSESNIKLSESSFPFYNNKDNDDINYKNSNKTKRKTKYLSNHQSINKNYMGGYRERNENENISERNYKERIYSNSQKKFDLNMIQSRSLLNNIELERDNFTSRKIEPIIKNSSQKGKKKKQKCRKKLKKLYSLLKKSDFFMN